MSSAIQEKFQEVSLEQLQLAVDMMEGRPEVTDIWIYTSWVGGALSGFVVYGAEGKAAVRAHNLDSLLKEPVGSMAREWQSTLNQGVAAAAMQLFGAYREAGEEHPSRIVVHYDVRGAKMDASFSYNKLDSETMAPTPIFEKWLENAVETGDFSADATTVPGSDG
ncbi:MAG: hypothetical protein Q4G45_12905 [Actinomycetia bacterium]|nr:hypothetical protein [Actinomycetes bacterium]